MKTLTILSLLLCCFLPAGSQSFRVMSYNVENLFDTEDDPLTDDNEFLPTGNRRWTGKRYYHKLQQIAKVITAAGEWDTPALVGLCEVENDTVVTHLLSRTPLRNQHYRYCLSDMSDKRGIRVALLYQRDRFRYLGRQSVPVRFKSRKTPLTRDILHVWGEVITGDTLDVMVCHFPSKYGGEKESEFQRMDAARTLRHLCDSLTTARTRPHLLLMGDFNDPPGSRCMQYATGSDLCNLFADKRRLETRGTQKYQANWSQLDQILVSPSLLDPASKIRCLPESARNLSFPFLLTDDKTWQGIRPRRTYHGFKYEAGFSDHLPIVVDFFLSLGTNN